MTNQTISDFRRDTITAEEQAMIDAHIRKHGVTRCPYGERTTEPTYIWNGKDLIPDGMKMGWRAQIKNAVEARRKANIMRADVQEAKRRREAIKPLIAAGFTAKEIAARYGISVKRIRDDAKRLGTPCRNPQSTTIEEWLANQ